MHPRVQVVDFPFEATEFTEEVRQIFPEIGQAEALVGECSPALDVHDTDEAVVITVDLPGVDAEAVRIVVKGAAVLIAGKKAPRRAQAGASFHLVERGYGRFARTVRLTGFTGACDARLARATLETGELRIRLPRVGERRGVAIPIAIVKTS